jgi:hypothetical protein
MSADGAWAYTTPAAPVEASKPAKTPPAINFLLMFILQFWFAKDTVSFDGAKMGGGLCSDLW